MKEYIINKKSEWLENKGHYWLLQRHNWDGNLIIPLTEVIVVEEDLYVQGDLNVSGALKVTRELEIEEDLYVQGDLKVEENLNIEGGLAVYGDLYVKRELYVNKELNVKGELKAKTLTTHLPCRWRFIISKNTLGIGGKKRTWDAWEKWFASEEEYQIPRGTEKFELLQLSFEIAKVYRKMFIFMEE